MTLVNEHLAAKSQSYFTSSWYIGFQISISVKKIETAVEIFLFFVLKLPYCTVTNSHLLAFDLRQLITKEL